MSQLRSNHRSSGLPGQAAGVTLVELLVAMTIGLVLIIGATQVYVDSHTAYAVNETTARLQENARYAMSVLEPDIRMSGYWGLTNVSDGIGGERLPTDAQFGLGAPPPPPRRVHVPPLLGLPLQGAKTSPAAPRAAHRPPPP